MLALEEVRLYAYLLPSGDLFVGPDAGSVRQAACLTRDEGSFCDDEGAGDAGALGVVFDSQVRWDRHRIATIARQRGMDHAMREDDVAEANGPKEGGVGGGDHVRSRNFELALVGVGSLGHIAFLNGCLY